LFGPQAQHRREKRMTLLSSPTLSRKELENVWMERLEDAQRRYRLAKTDCAKVAAERANRVMPSPDGEFALRQALRLETAALAEYKRVLKIFVDLTVNNKLPPQG
jgi:hypothetical protein